MSFPGGMSLFTLSSVLNTGAEPGVTVAAGAKLLLAPTTPVAVLRWGFICTTLVNDASNALKLSLDWHPTVGSAASSVVGATTVTATAAQWNASNQGAFATDLAGGSITLTASASQIAAGKGVYHLMQPQTKMPPNDASTNPVPSPDTAFVPGGGEMSLGLTVYPGQEVLLNSNATAPGAGAGIFFIHFWHLAFEGQGAGYGAINNSALATGIPSSITPVVGDPGIWTRFIS